MEKTSSAKFVLQAWTVNTDKLSQLRPAVEDGEFKKCTGYQWLLCASYCPHI